MQVRLRCWGDGQHFLTRRRSRNFPRLRAPQTYLAAMSHKAGIPAALLFFFCSALLADDRSDPVPVKVWHTYGTGSMEERLFTRAVDRFSADHPGIAVEVVGIPYLQNLMQFINAAQAGEAPDLIRLSDTELGKIGHITVEGLPLLEDLRAHLTPRQKRAYLPHSLFAMRYEGSLYALPASRSGMTLLYNADIFDAAGLAYPDPRWRLEDLLRTAKTLTTDGITGLALPVRWSYWFVPFIAASGGKLLDDAGNPALSSPGTAKAMEWVLDLARLHGVTGSINSIEAMSTRFQTGRAAMVIDGPWNWDRYSESGIRLGQSLLPYDASTGKRLAPMVGYFGWSVAKQSGVKPAAVKLAQWLSSPATQREFALGTYSLPTLVELMSDPAITGHPVLGGFIEQARFGTPTPTTRLTAMVFEQLDTALALTYDGTMTAGTALEAADRELERMLKW